VREALRAHVGREITAEVVIQWVRRERGAVVLPSSVSGALASVCNGDEEITLVRIARGVYRVDGAAAPLVPEPVVQAPAPDNHAGTLSAGALLEVVHVTRHGLVVAADDDGTMYLVTPK